MTSSFSFQSPRGNRYFILGLNLLLLGATLFVSSCGRKAPPVVPELTTPSAVSQVTAVSRDNRAYLSWSRPAKSLKGKPAREIMEFEIYRREVKQEGAALPATLIAKVKANLPENAKVSGDSYEFVDDGQGRGLSYDQQYAYHLRAINFGQGPGPPSKEVMVRIDPGPNPPSFLKAIGGDKTVFLSWEAPRFRTDGKELTSPPLYNLYRGKAPQSYDSRPINTQPIEGRSFIDTGLANEVSYYYTVRAIDPELPSGHESLESNEAVAIPSDTTPPSRPRNLSAALAGKEVRLAWDANPEADLAGYFVYRSLYPGVGHIRLNLVPTTKVTFVDKNIPPATILYYAVSAVDSSPQRNESGLSEEVKVEIP